MRKFHSPVFPSNTRLLRKLSDAPQLESFVHSRPKP
jgi:hypothetical protein